MIEMITHPMVSTAVHSTILATVEASKQYNHLVWIAIMIVRMVVNWLLSKSKNVKQEN